MRLGRQSGTTLGLALSALLSGCLIDSPSSGDDYPPPGGSGGWGSGWGGTGGDTGFGCHSDTECGGSSVCARDGECVPASSVRYIHVDWTVKGVAASDTTCSHAPQLAVTFRDSAGSMFGFAPVPCDAGRYTIDKLPTRFSSVELARNGDYSGGASGTFDASGTVTLDLPY